MKKTNFLNIALCTSLVLAAVTATAREQLNKPHKTNSHVSFKTDAGDCVAATAQFDLDINNVRARLLTGGDAWWNFSEPKYEVPKGDGTHPLCAIFAGAIWISGYDAGGNLKCAAQRYRQNGNDFWPGPLAANASIDQATCIQYDRHFSVYGTDIGKAQAAFASKGTQTTTGDIPKGVLAWPAKGNPYLQTDPSLIGQTFNITDNLAPFKDVDHDGIYDPVKGDFPIITSRDADATAFADQMVFWVFNDVGNIHTESNGVAIGAQVNALAFAFQTTDEINNMTFYKYEVINKSSNSLFQTYLSQWVDPDLGCAFNDRVGCDTARSLGIVYNGATPDNDCQNENGYGYQLPILGVDFFEGPLSDSGKQLGMSSFVYFTNGATFAKSDPNSAAQYRNYQTGFWADGTPFTFGADGYTGSVPTNFIFPGDPSDATQWSECQPAVSAILPADDRRFVQSSGPFTLKPGVAQYVTVGVVFVRPNTTNGVGLCPSFNALVGPADDKAQALFNTGFKVLDGPAAPTLQIRELDNQLVINLVNEGISNNIGESYNQVDGVTEQAVKQYLGGHGDSSYHFEGYKVYQVSNPSVSASDLNDPTKARLVAQVDVKNNVSKIVNYIKDATLGILIPTLEVDGADNGITNSFSVTTDLFATGKNSTLINHTTYYYAAVAYAYNNYLPFDITHPERGGQQLPYLQGRNNFKVYAAVPHIPDPRNTGTILNSKWGDGVEVRRYEGQGNGGNVLDLSPETVAAILGSGFDAFKDTLLYTKGHDPIGFQVTDPVSLKEADFVLQIVDTAVTDTGNQVLGSSARWVLTDLTNNVTIPSERSLDRPYQQQIMDSLGNSYGFSIKLGTPLPIDLLPGSYLAPNNSPSRPVYGADGTKSDITFQDPLKSWLSFVKDEGSNTVTNWIRSGTDAANPTPQQGAISLAGVYDDNWYYTAGNGSGTPPAYPNFIFDDTGKVYDKIAGGTWAPYCLAANYSNKTVTTAGVPPFVYGPGFKWRNYGGTLIAPPQNTLDRLASVDIVITPDKTKWTQCLVFETGEDESINLGNDLYPRTNSPLFAGKGAIKGQIRMSYSKDWNDPNSRDYLKTVFSDTGRSWFPGYAINVETGERLNIGFGESSDQGDENGRDMLWNPTADLYSPITFPFAPIPQIPFFGGKHFIYVWDTKYDGGRAAQQILLRTYDSIATTQNGTPPRSVWPVYRDLMWTSIPYLSQGYSFDDDGHGSAYIPPAEVKVRLRVDKPFRRMLAVSPSVDGDSLPRYEFSTKGMGATENNLSQAKSALDLIKIVPNPYLSYSAYEPDANTPVVKVVNLPNVCTITIFSLDGTIIRVLKRSIGVDPGTSKKIETSDGTDIQDVNVSSSIDWDMKNDKGIPIASGIYLFHVDAPGIGQKTLKWFGTMRPADTSNY